MTSTYPSKVDWWIAALVVGAPLLCMVAPFVVPTDANEPPVAVMVFGFGLFYVGVLALVAFPTRYTLTGGELVVRSGMLRRRLAYEAVTGARPTRNPLSAPAWSLDRLRIDYFDGHRSGYLLISPRDKSAFLADLQARCPRLVRNGDTLSRR